MSKQNYHFFAATCLNWRTGESALKCLTDLKRDTTRDTKSYGNQQTLGKTIGYQLWFVPLPADAHYKINQYRPVVDGCICVESCNVEPVTNQTELTDLSFHVNVETMERTAISGRKIAT